MGEGKIMHVKVRKGKGIMSVVGLPKPCFSSSLSLCSFPPLSLNHEPWLRISQIPDMIVIAGGVEMRFFLDLGGINSELWK